MKAFNQIRNAIELIKGFKGTEPLNVYLKNEFKKRPQFGSNDRRLMRELCICYFKVGIALPLDSYELRILAGYFLNNQSPHPVFEFLATECKQTELIESISQEWEIKIRTLEKIFSLNRIYPLNSSMSAEIDTQIFYQAFFMKPTTWLRVRPKAKERFEEYLHQQENSFFVHSKCAVAYGFSDTINIASWPPQIRSAVEVQDIASQLSLYHLSFQDGEKVWDCCAGSGGKSLLLHSIHSKISLYVSDVRQTIIKNLVERFATAGIGNCMKAVVDLTKPQGEITFENNKERKSAGQNYFDTILVDAPCSGSGTWRRNPERLIFFNNEEAKKYMSLQKEIVKHALKFLKPNGRLIYLTCSLYEEENTQMVSHLCQENNLIIENNTLFNQLNDGGDIIFRSILKKVK